jgi:hypothetical protein
MNQINAFADTMGIYDPKFAEDDQCSGYYAFVGLCLLKDPLGAFPSKPELHLSFQTGSRPGVYLLTKLHENIRKASWEAAKYIQSHYFNMKTKHDE